MGIREKHAQEQTAKRSASVVLFALPDIDCGGSNSRQTEIERMEAEIRKLSKRQNGDDSDDEPSKKKVKQKSYLEEELAKYAKGRGQKKKNKRKDESDVLAALNSFRNKLHTSMLVDDDSEPEQPPTDEAASAPEPGTENAGIEVDDDVGFLTHALHFVRSSKRQLFISLD